MGVQGLWHLLQPCARPTKLESLEGKRLAIDSSIWLYHFQMAMRDKEGRTLSNAHILGFLWRILKLIHFGIRPIFVFDGGAPVLKRKTLSGRKTRKAGARDDHRRVAERLLHARMREAAVAHVTGNSGTGNDGEGASGDAASSGHGLGDTTVYMDDLAGSTGASAALETAPGGADDGAISAQTIRDREKEAEAARKKKRDQWQKDPYALPALDKEISQMTAENSARARKAKGGGKRPDVRFATEGELRSLLSSIQPTDLDLDSEFFRSLPAELQYELVGDLRAASRGTSYKRLQAMLAQSPTPIDFSRAQIAGLKTRNELTQKVLEVTDEIGDAHIKVPIRVAGARNREYVLVRNKGDQAGFVLGVREAGNSEEKAIAVDEDTASATTFEDEGERRNTEDEFDLEEVSVQESPIKAVEAPIIPAELQDVNPNDPMARKKVARELLQRRARQLAKERAREKGNVDEDEILEEQLEKVRQARRVSTKGAKNGSSKAGAPDAVFRRIADAKDMNMNIERIGQEDFVDAFDYDEADDEADDDRDDGSIASVQAETISDDEAEDLARALDESEAANAPDTDLQDISGEDVVDEQVELDEVDTNVIDPIDYATFYGKNREEGTIPPITPDKQSHSPKKTSRKRQEPQRFAPQTARTGAASAHAESDRFIKSSSGLGFRLSDREGYPERLDPKLTAKLRWDADQELDSLSTQNVEKGAGAYSSSQETVAAAAEPSKASNIPDQSAQEARSDGKGDLHRAHLAEDRQFQVKEEIDTMQAEFAQHREERHTLDSVGNDIHIVDFREEKKVGSPVPGDSHISKVDGGRADTVFPSAARTNPQVGNNIHNSSHSSTPTSGHLKSADNDGIQDTKVASRGSLERNQHGRRDSEEEASPDAKDKRISQRSSSRELTVTPPLEEHPDRTSPRLTPETARNVAEHALADPMRAPEFDNITSMQDESGEYPRIDQDELPETLGREERERSQFSDDWPSELPSRSPSPERGVILGPDGFPLPTAEELDALEAEDEAELGQIEGDQDEFVSFLSRAKGRGLREVRQEVEDEVNQLRLEHAATRRAEGDITIQMAKEIQLMLRLFGLPYITAPMEAEAQCAELVAIGLADGIITDDSDVFLFGGTFVYKNMFNNKKYVECYKLSDLNHDLGMDRTKLVQLAYLLGSDYTDGLEGVGPVLAMEILSNFTGDDGLIKFRDWWLKVQTGSDTPRDTHNSTLKRLKRTLRNKVHFDTHWPDANVLNAYYEPTVDNSEEPFQWGLPDLDSLRSFFNEYLRWDREKTDHYLLPAIEEQNKRHRRTQATLDTSNFFDLSGGQAAAAGRVRPGYNSSRLQQVISNFRKGKAASSKTHARGGKDQEPVDLSDSGDAGGEEDEVPEQQLGKEMGKRSRPVVAGTTPLVDHDVSNDPAQSIAGHGERAEQGVQKKSRKTTSKPDAGSGTGRGRGRGRGRGGKNGTKRGVSAQEEIHDTSSASARQIQDEEWQPRAPKRRRAAERSDSGTSLTQGRRMNLDSIDRLVPPSRAALRRDHSSSSSLLHTPSRSPTPEDAASAERTPIELSDDSSSLSSGE